ncbi:NYN domain-containing protein [Pelagerythrobacter marinus]|uniref:NYN domain-containing protein n=1 Tax=Pelagerythrobacter marinus TaxID=538382 RepID=UPI0020371F41|nr:NYN domain-containing protein [Pelagerythrobacter marinus]USA40658.1 NYN domain-containing protein [Pelagerythrobacter marinus]WPZ08170.1 NYN domain-containing protein [Pelagerythrobacter marinus]
MSDELQHRNIALLIDSDNASPAGIDPVLTVLAELGQVNIRRAYGNWRKPALKSWADLVHRYGIEPQQQFDLTRGKNATDMKMTIDAMDMMYRGRVHGFGIMSSDSDFMPLAMRIRQDGYPVYGFGSAKTPEGFRQACTRFIDVDALIRAEKEERANGGNDGGKGPLDDDMLHLLFEAYNASKRDQKGFAKLSEVGQRAGNRSSFDTRNYGYARLIDLVEAIPNFAIERRENDQIWIKRLR